MLTVVAPDVPVTVIAAGPIGVPDGPGPELLDEAPQPAITTASARIAKDIVNARRRRLDS